MRPAIRQYFFKTFALFFIIIAPVISIFSLGYDIDFKNRTLQNTLSISLDVTQIGKEVVANNKKISGFNNNLKISDGTLVDLKISAQGYIPETFTLFGEQGENTSARITELTLWPQNYSTLFEESDTEIEVVLSDTKLVLKNQSNDYFISIFGLNGLQGRLLPLNGAEIPSDSVWESVDDSLFWNRSSDQIIYERNREWFIKNISLFTRSCISVIRISDQNIACLNNDGNLWDFNFVTNVTTFIDADIDGLHASSSPDAVWIAQYGTIYRTDRARLSSSQLFLDSPSHTYTHEIDREFNAFQVEGIYLGILFKTGNILEYIPDSEPFNSVVISRQAEYISVEGNNIFWTQGDYVVTRNLFTNDQEIIDSFTFDDSVEYSMTYIPELRRLLLFSPDSVYGVWYDKDILNTSIIDYSFIEIDTNASCFHEVFERKLFCEKTGSLISYDNPEFF